MTELIKPRGKFVVVEGIDGVGKAKGFLDIFAEEARKDGRKVFDVHDYWKAFDYHPSIKDIAGYFDLILTSEPTFAGLGRYLREEMIARNERDYSPEADAEAYALDRRILYEQLVLPALEVGIDVYQSRSLGSSLVYQYQSALDKRKDFNVSDIANIPGNKFCLSHPMDYLVISTIKDVEEALQRSQSRDKDDQCKFENLEFQLKIKEHYESDWFREIFESRGVKVAYLDAGKTLEYSEKQARDFYQQELKKIIN